MKTFIFEILHFPSQVIIEANNSLEAEEKLNALTLKDIVIQYSCNIIEH